MRRSQETDEKEESEVFSVLICLSLSNFISSRLPLILCLVAGRCLHLEWMRGVPRCPCISMRCYVGRYGIDIYTLNMHIHTHMYTHVEGCYVYV